MTKPDWADEKVLDIAFKDEPGPLGEMYTIPAKYVAQALRDAYAAGLERAAEIAEGRAGYYPGADYYGFAAAIRAEKETK